jgi:type IV secretory pathway ATPase VirB11/archaellum biosynthesis ATPase
MEGANEININGYGGFFVLNGAKTWIDCEAINEEWMYGLADLVGTSSKQCMSGSDPIMSAHIDTGERIELSMPPLVDEPIASIRIHSLVSYTMDDYAFREDWIKQALIELVIKKKTIVFVGETFSGKSSLLSTACSYIPPDDRILTLEDSKELNLPKEDHPDQIRFLFNRSEQRLANVTTKEIFRSCLRYNPDWIMLGELRDKEAFEFLSAAKSGHRAMTTLHAGSGLYAMSRLANLVGLVATNMTHEQILDDLASVVHAIVYIALDHDTGLRTIEEIYYPGSDK